MSNRTPAGGKKKLAIIVGGTAVAAVVAGLSFQFFRGEETNAQVESPAAGAGVATLDDMPRKNPRHLARVNGTLISWETVANECMAREGGKVLENIINRTIIQQACEERGITVTKVEVDQEIEKIAKRFQLPVESWYQMLQAERNLSPLQYKRDVIWPMLALKKLAGADVNVSQDDMHKAFIRDYGPRVKAKMIMLDNQRRAMEVHQKATAEPANFERLVMEHSIEPNSRALGGDIPPIRRFSGNDKIEDAAFKLEPGEISPVIQAGLNRYVILQCEGRTEPRVNDISEVRESLYEHLLEEKVQTKVAEVFENLKKQAQIDNYLTNTSTGGVRQTSGGQPATKKQQYPPRAAGRAPQTRR